MKASRWDEFERQHLRVVVGLAIGAGALGVVAVLGYRALRHEECENPFTVPVVALLGLLTLACVGLILSRAHLDVLASKINAGIRAWRGGGA